MSDQLRGLLITFVGVVFVVPDSLFVRLIEADPLVISFWRGISSGSLLLLGILVFQGSAPFRAVLSTGLTGVIYMAASGGAGILFVLAVSLTSVANVVFIIAAMPVFASIYSRIFLGEPFSSRMLWTMAAVGLGLAVIAYGSDETQGATRLGDAVALGVAALFAAGLTAARRARPVSMVPAVPLGFLGASFCLWIFVDPISVPDGQGHLIVLHGLFIAVSSVGLALGPRYITSPEVALLILLESVLAPLLVWVAIGEDPGPYAIIGGAVVISALAMSNLVALRRRGRLPV